VQTIENLKDEGIKGGDVGKDAGMDHRRGGEDSLRKRGKKFPTLRRKKTAMRRRRLARVLWRLATNV